MFSLHELPNSIEVDGVTHEVNMAFDNIIKVYETFMSDKEPALRYYNAVLLLFGDELPYEPQKQIEVVDQVNEQLIATKEEEIIQYDLKGNPMPKVPTEEGEGAEYCIVRDMQYIYPSFLQDYNIDLLKQKGKMHWWTFKVLLSGLSHDTKFKHVLDIRSRKEDGLKGNDLEALREAKKLYALKPYGKAVPDERG